MGNDSRRIYYDHEPAYRRVGARSGGGWDPIAPNKHGNSHAALQRFLESEVISALRQRFKSVRLKAIDLGCGGGQGSLLLAERGFDVTGIDFSPTAVEIAKLNLKQLGEAADVVEGDCLAMPAEWSGQFHLAIDNHTLHCLIEPHHRRLFLSEVNRVLVRGGTFFSETMSAAGHPDFASLGVEPHTRIDRSFTRFWVTPEQLQQELHEAGLTLCALATRHQPDRPNPGDTLVTVSVSSF